MVLKKITRFVQRGNENPVILYKNLFFNVPTNEGSRNCFRLVTTFLVFHSDKSFIHFVFNSSSLASRTQSKWASLSFPLALFFLELVRFKTSTFPEAHNGLLGLKPCIFIYLSNLKFPYNLVHHSLIPFVCNMFY